MAPLTRFLSCKITSKRENKEKILALLAEKSELSNVDIRESLGISGRSAIRYMDELEREGKVERVGNTGRGVIPGRIFYFHTAKSVCSYNSTPHNEAARRTPRIVVLKSDLFPV